MSLDARKQIDDKQIQMLPIVGKKPATEKDEKWLRELVEYEFHNIEEPGLVHSFTYGSTKLNHNFKFFHGGKYKIPRFIAHHVNNCGTPLWKWTPDGSGAMVKSLIGKNSRFQMREIY